MSLYKKYLQEMKFQGFSETAQLHEYLKALQSPDISTDLGNSATSISFQKHSEDSIVQAISETAQFQ